MKIRLAALALPVLLAGCSAFGPSGNAGGAKNASQPGRGPLSAGFVVRWRQNIAALGDMADRAASPIVHPGQVRWRMRGEYGDMGNSVLRPAVLGGAAYAADAAGDIARVDAATGRRQWRVHTGITITGGVTAEDGLILVGGEKGDILAYGEDGKLRWRTVATTEVLSPPEVADGIVVVRTEDGNVAGLDAASGKRKWMYEHTMPALVVRSSAGMVIRQGTIYVGFAGGKLVALDLASGNVKWETILSEPRGTTELERISDITSTPRMDDTEVCAVSFQGRVGCFGLSQGNLIWSRDYSSDKGMAMDDKNVYAVSVEGEILALNKSTGSSAWKNAELDKKHTAAPAVLGDYLVVGDKNGMLYAIRREDGGIAARMSTDGSPIWHAPVEVDGGLLVQTYAGGLYSVTLK